MPWLSLKLYYLLSSVKIIALLRLGIFGGIASLVDSGNIGLLLFPKFKSCGPSEYLLVFFCFFNLSKEDFDIKNGWNFFTAIFLTPPNTFVAYFFCPKKLTSPLAPLLRIHHQLVLHGRPGSKNIFFLYDLSVIKKGRCRPFL